MQNCCVVLCIVCFVSFYVLFVCKCVLPPGDNPIAVNKYIISNTLRLVPVLTSLLSTSRPSNFFGTLIRCNITVTSKPSPTQPLCKPIIQITDYNFTYERVICLILTIPIIFNKFPIIFNNFQPRISHEDLEGK